MTRNGPALLIYASVASVQHGHGIDSRPKDRGGLGANASCGTAGRRGAMHSHCYVRAAQGWLRRGWQQASVSAATVVTTLAVTWGTGADLRLNFASPGSVRVAVVDPASRSKPITGYANTLRAGGVDKLQSCVS